MTGLRLAFWLALAVVQLGVPGWMIVGQERILRDGHRLKLHTRPVDPADLFRGRYVALGFTVEQVPRNLAPELFAPGETAYLALREGADGFAEIVALTKENPAGNLVLKVQVTFVSDVTVGVELPFNRYYMDESAAPAAEAAYRQQSRDEANAWVTVRILDDRAVIEELYLGGKPVREFLREAR